MSWGWGGGGYTSCPGGSYKICPGGGGGGINHVLHGGSFKSMHWGWGWRMI